MPRKDVLARAHKRSGVEIIQGEMDRPGLVALTKLMYPSSDIADLNYISWQYDQNPAGPAIVRLARIGNGIVGQYTVIPVVFKIGNSTLKASLSLNTMTHPDHRAKGIFMILAEEVYAACQKEGLSFTLGFPNQNSFSGFSRHLQFKVMGELPLWILPLDWHRLTQSFSRHRKKLNAFAQVFQPAWNTFRKIHSVFQHKVKGLVEEVRTFDSSFDRLWEEAKTDYGCLVKRDQSYLRWRFQHHPTRHYRTWVHLGPNGMNGYLVGRVMDVNGIRCGMLVDLFANRKKTGEDATFALVGHAIRELKNDGAALIGCLLPKGTPGAKAMRNHGFWTCPRRFLPQPFPVIFRWHGDEELPPSAAASFKNWYITMGDYDAV